MSLLTDMHALDAALVRVGWPALSPFWRGTFARFSDRGSRRLVLRVGRRGGKSTSLCRLAVAIGLWGDWTVPPGDIGHVAFVSVSRDEANQRLRTIRSILDVLGIKYEPVENGIEVTGWRRPVVFKTFVCTLSGVVGFTAAIVIADELARWRDGTGSNPATEVLASLAPTLATTRGPLILSSSPLSSVDAHARAFDLGDTAAQTVAHAPTWIAHPALTEAMCHEDEPDERLFLREYAATPQGSTCDAFTDDEIERAFTLRSNLDPLGPPIMVTDPSSGKADSWTAGLMQWFAPRVDPADFYVWGPPPTKDGRPVLGTDGQPARGPRLCDPTGSPLINPHYAIDTRPVLRLHGMWSWAPHEIGSAEEVVRRIAQVAHANGANIVLSDQRESFLLGSAFYRNGLRFVEHTWTVQSKADAFAFLARHFREGTISIERNERMRDELKKFAIKILPSGVETYGARGAAHDDHVALLMTGSMGAIAGQIVGGPFMPARSGKRTDVTDHHESWV